jgi:hypothetical protein
MKTKSRGEQGVQCSVSELYREVVHAKELEFLFHQITDPVFIDIWI